MSNFLISLEFVDENQKSGEKDVRKILT